MKTLPEEMYVIRIRSKNYGDYYSGTVNDNKPLQDRKYAESMVERLRSYGQDATLLVCKMKWVEDAEEA